MKARYTVTIFVAAMGTCAVAQPNLPSGAISFAPGESYLYHQSDWTTPADSGVVNAAWDQSGLVSNSTMSDVFSAPTGGPAGSTVAEYAGPSAYAYYKATAGAFEQLGLISPQYTLTCSNPITVVSYPFTYGSVVNDTYDCMGNSAGTPYIRQGTIQIAGASWGTLTLPYGTFSNVLMLKVRQYHLDSVPSDPDFPTEYYAYFELYVKPGVKAPLFSNYEVYSVPGPYTIYSKYLDQNSMGVAEAQRNAIGVDLAPNPAKGQVEVLYGTAPGSSVSLEVFDVAGKCVARHLRGTMTTGVQREVLDISGLAAGAYSVRVTDDKGASGTKQLIIQ